MGLERQFTTGPNGRPHIFLFSHAPIQYALNDVETPWWLGGHDEPTHALDHDENFIQWVVDDNPLLEVAFAGHLHAYETDWLGTNGGLNLRGSATGVTIPADDYYQFHLLQQGVEAPRPQIINAPPSGKMTMIVDEKNLFWTFQRFNWGP